LGDERPNARKTLEVLHDEWEGCTKCELGVRRKDVDGAFVFGEGERRGIMFIGEGPGRVEEEQGQPFVGPSGKILRKVIETLGITDYFIGNCVACRSCGPAYNSEGEMIMRKNRATQEMEPLIRDQAPTPLHIKECLPRLYEQIYLVDPVLIVALGAEAASALRGKPVKITSERGTTEAITIPGAWNVPVLTEKRKVWRRKVRGEIVMPTAQNQVRYLMMPTIHPAYVLRFHGDRRQGNPLSTFVEDIKKAVSIYNRYMLEVHGIQRAERELDPLELELEEA
jgi:uracil-DNA glycosylase